MMNIDLSALVNRLWELPRKFYIASGFAPGTKDLIAAGELFPKWLDSWELGNEGDANWVLEFGADYCLYHLIQSGQKRRCFLSLPYPPSPTFPLFFFGNIWGQNIDLKYLEKKRILAELARKQILGARNRATNGNRNSSIHISRRNTATILPISATL